MIFPNIDCYYLCVWMLTISKQRLTGPQTTLTTVIRDAALYSTPVSETEWNNFNQYAAWRNPYYLVYRDYQTAYGNNLLSGLTNYYAFEGNSNDSIGGINGVDTNISYNSTYGKILQGARNNALASVIDLGSTSSFNYIHNTAVFSINFWFRPLALGGTYYPIGSTTLATEKGFRFSIGYGANFLFVINNGLGGSNNTVSMVFSPISTALAFQMITVVGDGSVVKLYLNSVLVASVPIGALSAGDATNGVNVFNSSALSGANQFYMDELGFWSRPLTPLEVVNLYNNSAGLTYPF